jgi:lipoate---protein ligase
MIDPSLRGLEWELIPATPQTAHMHMALDEVLLDRVIAGGRKPAVRFWTWTEKALVIGSHQSVMNEIDMAAARRRGFKVTRRISGGGTMICEPDRTITYSMYLPATAVRGMSFRESYAALDAWAVAGLVAIGVPASYREINDIISPRGKIAGAAQARRRGFVLHHTTMAHSMDVAMVRRLIRLGRENLSGRGARSADKEVSPLSWFTELDCAATMGHLERFFQTSFGAQPSALGPEETEAARRLVEGKYSTLDWINRIP